jgi:hypothetical protein
MFVLRMLRRFLWLASGFGLGVTAAVRARRAVERAVDRLRPVAVVESSRTRVGEAVSTGRSAMAQKEAQLRATVDGRSGPGRARPPRSFS